MQRAEKEREEDERREYIELSLYSYYSNYNESTTTARGRTPVTLTVEEPRKFCVLFYLFHCTHIVDFTTRYQHEKLSCQWKA